MTDKERGSINFSFEQSDKAENAGTMRVEVIHPSLSALSDEDQTGIRLATSEFFQAVVDTLESRADLAQKGEEVYEALFGMSPFFESYRQNLRDICISAKADREWPDLVKRVERQNPTRRPLF